MTKSPEDLPQTTVERPEGDVIGDALRALRIRGTLLLRETHRPPFRVAVPSAAELEALLGVPAGSRAVAFHLVERGRFELRRQGGEPLALESGELVLGVGGQPHQLEQGRSTRTIGFAELLDGATGRLLGPAPPGDLGSTRIICGALVFGDIRLNPLFGSLPDFLPIRAPAGESGGRIDQLTSLLLAEIDREDPAADYVIERLLEVLCAEGIRAYASEREGGVGWFQGVADRAVGRAMRAFHAAPGRRWTVAELAAEAHLSPSRFAARFVEVTGATAMTYVSRWRMNVATRALSETDRSVSELAFRLGYESPAAFSRAFKRHVGASPTEFRKNGRGSA